MAKKINRSSKYWWLYLVFGIIALVCGGNFCAYPLSALSAISVITGVFLIFAGASNIITVFFDRKNTKLWWLYIILSIVILTVGVTLVARHSFSLKIIWLLTGLGFAAEAVIEIISAINIKKANYEGWVPLLVLGILTGIAALAILTDPIFGLRFVSVFVTVGVICFGIKLIVLAFQVKPQK